MKDLPPMAAWPSGLRMTRYRIHVVCRILRSRRRNLSEAQVAALFGRRVEHAALAESVRHPRPYSAPSFGFTRHVLEPETSHLFGPKGTIRLDAKRDARFGPTHLRFVMLDTHGLPPVRSGVDQVDGGGDTPSSAAYSPTVVGGPRAR